MNTALVITGHFRCWKSAYPNFKERFIDRFPNSDVFIHCWKDEGYWVKEVAGVGAKGYHEHSPLLDYEAVRAVYKPVRLVVEDADAFLPYFEERVKVFTNFYHRPRNICSMFYKLAEGIHMLERHIAMTGKHYDLVIRVRPDMILHQPIPDLDPEIFYTIWSRNHMGGGTGDMLQISNLDNMIRFSKIGINLERLYQQTGLLCPHVMSVQWIKNLGFTWEELMIAKNLTHSPSGEYKEWKK